MKDWLGQKDKIIASQKTEIERLKAENEMFGVLKTESGKCKAKGRKQHRKNPESELYDNNSEYAR